MKKIILGVLLLISFSLITNAQEYDEKTFTINPAIYGGLASSDSQEEGVALGVDVKGEYFASDFYRIILSAGYLNYAIKDGGGTYGLIPLQLGVKRHFSEVFYVGTGLGVTSITKGGGTYFSYGFNLGGIIQQHIDLGVDVKYSSRDGSGLIIAGLRLGYKL